MARILGKIGIVPLTSLLLILSVLAACDDGDDGKAPTPTPTAEPTPELVKITIGNHTDMTGASLNAMNTITMVLEDLVEYYNENNLIPGVELKVISYDGQANPARDIPGYEWLRGNGADLIFTPIPFSPTTLKNKVNDDEFLLFAATGDIEVIEPPGYIFNLGTIPQHEAYTLLKWMAENDPDFPKDRPAKIGGAGWTEGYSSSWFAGAEEYAEAHPDQYEWIGGHLTNFAFTWGPEVEALKDADYVYPGVVLNTFVKEYRVAGYTGKFIGTSAQTAFFGLLQDSDLWDEVDGALFILGSSWWNDKGAMISFIKGLGDDKHPDDIESIIQQGMPYLSGISISQMLSIIGDAVEAVGPENFSSQALYKAAESFSMTVDGVPSHSFGKDKRWMVDLYAIYEARSTEKDIFRADPEWLPVILEP